MYHSGENELKCVGKISPKTPGKLGVNQPSTIEDSRFLRAVVAAALPVSLRARLYHCWKTITTFCLYYRAPSLSATSTQDRRLLAVLS